MDKLNKTTIKSGDVFYDVHDGRITKHTYVCKHPNNKTYHIVINTNEHPERWCESKLDGVLALGILIYQDALIESIKHQEARIEMYKGFLKEVHSDIKGDV
ncbi:MAG: hypothetical protein LBJ04_22510 [Sphingobacterium sp.]|jgi:hypothetical protein|nr:hypothetical protein [Sphingobacterium sp.]